MTSSPQEKNDRKELCEALFNFAIARDDLKEMIAEFPETSEANRVTVEYEIQLLKILSVGWGISFLMGNNPEKNALAESFWNAVHEFSQGISQMTSSTTGKDIDYFNILRERVDIYVNALNHFSDVNDPAIVIGPTFAKLCGCEEDTHTIASGKKIFNLSIGSVKTRLEAAQMI